MKRVWQIVLLGVGGTLLTLVIIGLVLPRHYRAERSTTINASPPQIHRFVEDFKEWPKWAMWDQRDPSLKYTFSGAERGVGAVHSWNSEHSGQGVLKITESDPQSGIVFSESIQGEENSGVGSIRYSTAGGITTVTWRDEGKLPIIIGGFFKSEMEENLEQHFQEGLKRLKQLVEADVTAGP